MIAFLQGELREKQPGQIIVNVAGVGYRLFIPISTYYGLPNVSLDVALHVYTHVREDVLSLYGFLTGTEHLLFERLISVAGVGPALALKVMSGLEPIELINSIRRGDRRRLNVIPGVGKKTAERLIVELRDKMPTLGDVDEPLPERSKIVLLGEDLVSAFLNLGYPRHSVEKIIDAVLTEGQDATFEQALKKVLRKLSS